VSRITRFNGLFAGSIFFPSSFDEVIENWDLSKGRDFGSGILNTALDSDLDGNHLTNAFLFLSSSQNSMFESNTVFNQTISGWNVSSATIFVSAERSLGFHYNALD
jgi:WD40 repeat protein